MCTNSEGSCMTGHVRQLALAFAGCLRDKYHNLMSWLILCSNPFCYMFFIPAHFISFHFYSIPFHSIPSRSVLFSSIILDFTMSQVVSLQHLRLLSSQQQYLCQNSVTKPTSSLRIELCKYHEIPKNLVTQKIAVIILKFEQCCSAIE